MCYPLFSYEYFILKVSVMSFLSDMLNSTLTVCFLGVLNATNGLGAGCATMRRIQDTVTEGGGETPKNKRNQKLLRKHNKHVF
jgi:hypothetical protein